MTVIVRPLGEADRAAWEPLWRGYNAFYDRPSIADDITQTTWTRFMTPGVPMYVLGAFEDHRLLGIAQYLFHFSTTAIGRTCYLQDLFTVPAARGKGVGRSLIAAVYAAAEEAGSPRVYWHTHETNHYAMLLYDKVAEKSGFLVYRKLF
jgi:GNAT superfamily N-acetyltransferase